MASRTGLAADSVRDGDALIGFHIKFVTATKSATKSESCKDSFPTRSCRMWAPKLSGPCISDAPV